MKKYIIIIVSLFTSLSAWAQPGWSIAPQDFQYAMTVTAEGLIDCQSSVLPEDLLGAFVDDSLRGTVSFGTDVEGKNLAFLIVYSNISQGELVEFKFYNDSDDVIIDLLTTVTFEENGSEGAVDNPFLLSNNTPPSDLLLNNLDITDVSATGDTIADFSVVDLDNDVYSYTLINDSINDNGQFEFLGDFLVLTSDVNIVAQATYLIEVEALDANGCGISDTFSFAITNMNEPPTEILFLDEDNIINENEIISSLVGTFQVVDLTVPDAHTYVLEVGGTDNASFTISNNELLSAEVFDYEEKEVYEILVRVTDAAGNFLIQDLTVQVNDVIELDDLKANNVITPNDDGFNDVFQVPNVELFDDYEFQVFNENGNLVFRRSPAAGYNNLWDGKTTTGNDLPTGVYYYVLKDSQSTFQFTGVVNLLRN